MTDCTDYRCAGPNANQKNIQYQTARGLWGIVGVLGTDDHPPFAYTVGLHKIGLPELILVGPLRLDLMEAVINTAGFYLRDNNMEQFEHGVEYINITNMPSVFLDVPEEQFKEYMFQAEYFYGHRNFKVQQMCWPDINGKFPWDENSEFSEDQKFHNLQTLLGNK